MNSTSEASLLLCSSSRVELGEKKRFFPPAALTRVNGDSHKGAATQTHPLCHCIGAKQLKENIGMETNLDTRPAGDSFNLAQSRNIWVRMFILPDGPKWLISLFLSQSMSDGNADLLAAHWAMKEVRKSGSASRARVYCW